MAGQSAALWIVEFAACHNIIVGFGASIVQWTWPDGRSYFEQPVTRVQAYRIILSEAMTALASRASVDHG